MTNKGQSRMERRNAKNKTNKNKSSIWKKISLSILGLIAVAVLIVSIWFGYYIFTAPKLDHSLLGDPASTKVYDINRDLFADLGQERRTKISVNDLPDQLIDAVLATEDVRFEEHSGIDLRRIVGAVFANITDGFGAEGGSTITQQVVKSSLLTPEKTLKRKVQEQWLALQLDRAYEKNEILEMYLNKIFYGNGAYGVATAAETYFSITDLDELTLAQSALLAGLPQRPSAYDPTNNPELAQQRMNTVLNLMVRHDKISEAEAEEAAQVDVQDMLNIPETTKTPYQAFLDQVRIEIEEKLDADLYNDGLKVYTTLDPSAQEHVEYLLSDESPVEFPDEELQSGLVAIETQTGAIKAIGGGRNREIAGFNMAIQAKRQPGSVIKPILDFGPAIEYLDWSTYHQIENGGPYEVAGSTPVANHNDQYGGTVSARYAMQLSLNVPTLHTLDEVGIGPATEFAENIGMPIPDEGLNIRDGIGGSTMSVSALEVGGAFSAFGNDGIYNEPYAVTEVIFGDGREESLKPDPIAAMSDATAYMITDMLRSVVQSGTGTAANISDLPMVGKTGTTDDNVDSWFAGYTTQYTISVWTGYEDSTRSIPTGYTSVSRQLFKQLMTEMSASVETEDFVMPDSVVRAQVERGSNPPLRPSEYTPDSEIVYELFKRGNEPQNLSDQYDRIEAVSNLSAEYDEDADEININWSHSSDHDVSFIVNYGIEDGSTNDSQTSDTSFSISSIERGVTYSIEVIAISTDNSDLTSDGTQIELRIPEEEIEEESEPEDDNEGEEPTEEPDEQEPEETPEEPEEPGDSEGNEGSDGSEDSGESDEPEEPGDSEDPPDSENEENDDNQN